MSDRGSVHTLGRAEARAMQGDLISTAIAKFNDGTIRDRRDFVMFFLGVNSAQMALRVTPPIIPPEIVSSIEAARSTLDVFETLAASALLVKWEADHAPAN